MRSLVHSVSHYVFTLHTIRFNTTCIHSHCIVQNTTHKSVVNLARKSSARVYRYGHVWCTSIRSHIIQWYIHAILASLIIVAYLGVQFKLYRISHSLHCKNLRVYSFNLYLYLSCTFYNHPVSDWDVPFTMAT